VNPPFTIEEFLGVFAAYNAAIWPLQIAAYVLGLIAIAAIWLGRLMAFRLILSILAAMWALNGIGYHFLFFSGINPAAKLFAGVFVMQAVLFLASAVVLADLRFEFGRNCRSIAGATIIIYAMVIYPILGLLAGHGLLAGPMFGVAPCPTTIFTIGLLMLARGKWVVWLSIIPLLWSLVGLAAAMQLRIPEDFGLPIAGFALMICLAFEALQTRRGRRMTTPLIRTPAP
jgi:Family of unknown function (DUF6064)